MAKVHIEHEFTLEDDAQRQLHEGYLTAPAMGVRNGDASQADDVRAGFNELKATLWSAADVVADIVGAEETSASFRQHAQDNKLRSLNDPAQYKGLDDLNSPLDVAGFIGEQITREIPSLAVDAGTVLGASALSGPVGGGAAAAAALKRRALMAAGTSILAQTTGDARMSLLEEGVDDPWKALRTGATNTALELVPVRMALDTAIKAWKAGGKTTDLGKEILKSTAKVGLAGGVTEPLQELNKYLTIASEKEDYDVLSDDNIENMIMSAIGGAGVSGSLGAVGQVGGTAVAMAQGRDSAGSAAENKGKDKDQLLSEGPSVWTPGDNSTAGSFVGAAMQIGANALGVDPIYEAVDYMLTGSKPQTILRASEQKGATENQSSSSPTAQGSRNDLYANVLADVSRPDTDAAASLKKAADEIIKSTSPEKITPDERAFLTKTAQTLLKLESDKYDSTQATNEYTTWLRDTFLADEEAADVRRPITPSDTQRSYLNQDVDDLEAMDIERRSAQSSLATGDNQPVRYAARKTKGVAARSLTDEGNAQVYKERSSAEAIASSMAEAEAARSAQTGESIGIEYTPEQVLNDNGDLVGYRVKATAVTDTGADRLRTHWQSAADQARKDAAKYSNFANPKYPKNTGVAFKGPDGKTVVLSAHTLVAKGLEQNKQDTGTQRASTRDAVRDALFTALQELQKEGYTLGDGKTTSKEGLAGQLRAAVEQAIIAREPKLRKNRAALAKAVAQTPVYTANGSTFNVGSIAIPTKLEAGGKLVDKTPGTKRKLDRGVSVSGEEDLTQEFVESLDFEALSAEDRATLADMARTALKGKSGTDRTAASWLLDQLTYGDGNTVDRDAADPMARVLDAENRSIRDNKLNADAASAKGSKIRNKKREPSAREKSIAASKVKWANLKDLTVARLSNSAEVQKKLVSYTKYAKNILGLNGRVAVTTEHDLQAVLQGNENFASIAEDAMADANTIRNQAPRGFSRVYVDEKTGDILVLVPSYAKPKSTMHAITVQMGRAYLNVERDRLRKQHGKELTAGYKSALQRAKVDEDRYSFEDWFSDQVAVYVMDYAGGQGRVTGLMKRKWFTDVADKIKGIINHFLDAAKVADRRNSTAYTKHQILRFSRSDMFTRVMDSMLDPKNNKPKKTRAAQTKKQPNKPAISADSEAAITEAHLELQDETPERQVAMVTAGKHKPDGMDQDVFDEARHEMASGYMAKVRAFFLDPKFREGAMNAGYAKIRRVYAGGTTPISVVLGDVDNRIREIGEPGSNARRAATKIANLLFTPQFEDGAKQGFESVVYPEMGLWLKSYTKALTVKRMGTDGEPVLYTEAEQKKIHEALVKSTPIEDITDPVTKRGVQRFRRVHKRFYDEVGSHIIIDPKGARMQFTRDHFPRLWDHTKILANYDAFIDMLNESAQKAGKTNFNAEAVADSLIRRGLDPTQDPESRVDSLPTSSHAKGRNLWFVSNEAAADWMVDDVGQVVSNYVQQMLKRHEFQSRFGGMKKDPKGKSSWSPRAKLDALLEEIPPQDRQLVEDRVAAALGQYKQSLSPQIKGAQALAAATFNVAFLGLSSLSSLVETAFVPMRMRDASFKDVIRYLKEAREDKGYKGIMERAREFGFTDDHLIQQVLNSVYGTPSVGTWTGRAADKMNETLFRYNGTMYLATMNRAIATALGERFLVDHADRAKNGDEKSRQYIAELAGKQHADSAIEAILRWNEAGRPTPSIDDTFRTRSSKEKISDTVYVQHLLGRYVDESVIRPMSGHKPLWASSPYFTLLAHLKNYFWGAQKVILPMLADAAAKTSMANLNAAMPLVYFGLFGMALSALGYEARHWVRSVASVTPFSDYDGRQAMSFGEYLLEIYARNNGFFALDPYITAFEYADGPVPVYDAFKSFVPVLSYLDRLASRGIGEDTLPVIAIL